MSNKNKITAEGSIDVQRKDLNSSPVSGSFRFTNSRVVSTDEPTVHLVNVSKCVGGNVRFELELDAHYEDGGSVRISGEARLFTGIDCDWRISADTQKIELTIPIDGTSPSDIHVEETTASDHYAKGTVTFTNIRKAD